MEKATSNQRKRCKHEIALSILNLCRLGERKTKIMYMSNLSYGLLCKYLKELEKKGFLTLRGKTYTTTPLGREILGGLETLILLWENVELPKPPIYV